MVCHSVVKKVSNLMNYLLEIQENFECVKTKNKFDKKDKSTLDTNKYGNIEILSNVNWCSVFSQVKFHLAEQFKDHGGDKLLIFLLNCYT